MPNARPMRENRASGVLCILVVIEPHELVWVKCDSDGEGKGMRGAERGRAAARRVVGLVRVGRQPTTELERSSSTPSTKDAESITPSFEYRPQFVVFPQKIAHGTIEYGRLLRVYVYVIQISA